MEVNPDRNMDREYGYYDTPIMGFSQPRSLGEHGVYHVGELAVAFITGRQVTHDEWVKHVNASGGATPKAFEAAKTAHFYEILTD